MEDLCKRICNYQSEANREQCQKQGGCDVWRKATHYVRRPRATPIFKEDSHGKGISETER